MIGERNVGKSAITQRYVEEVFNPNISATLGYDFITKTVQIKIKDRTYSVKLQLWDTGGSEQFHSVTKQFYRGAQGALIVYSITDQLSYSKVSWWIAELLKESPKCKIILIGNKADLEAMREVPTVDGANTALSYNTKFVETSASEGTNVDEAFRKLITDVVLDMMSSDDQESEIQGFSPLPKVEPASKKGMCNCP